MEESIVFAKKYLEDLLSFFGLNVEVRASSSDDVIELSIPSSHLNGFLIGERGDTLRALQFIVSSSLKNNDFAAMRVNVDVADYKKQRAQQLKDRAIVWINEVKASGNEKHLHPMNAADRRVVHQAAQEYGVASESDGEGRDRHIVLKPAE
ncbi:MAG: R3H domain-containing nucleic acid-binding protein [Candidatus Saccharimonadales bacterium]